MSDSQQASPGGQAPDAKGAEEPTLKVVGSAEAVEHAEEPPPEAAAQSVTISRKTLMIVGGVLLAVLLLVGGGLGYKFYTDKKAEERAETIAAQQAKEAAEKKKKAEAAARAEKALVADFDQVMGARAKILAAEAGANQQVTAAQAAAKAYQRAVKVRENKIKKALAQYEDRYNRVEQHNDLERSNYNSNPWFYTPDYWDYPEYPTEPDPIRVPSFDKQSKKLRQIDSSLRTVSASLDVLPVDPQFAKTLQQLKECATALSDEALNNADVLTTCVKPATEDDPGSLDAQELATLRSNGAKALFALVNDSALRFIKQHGLDTRIYDVRGGVDASKSDSSFILATPALASSEATGTK